MAQEEVNSFEIRLPDWAIALEREEKEKEKERERIWREEKKKEGAELVLTEKEKEEITKTQMSLVNQFARLNFQNDTGGPFASAIFSTPTPESPYPRLLVAGVNRVVPSFCSSAHAEVVTLSIAQRRLQTHDLGSNGRSYTLVVNWLPCAMCFGAVVWSGIRRLVVAGSGRELEEITGFDEGPRRVDWQRQLEIRGIEWEENVQQEEAIAVFQEFRQSGKIVYNGRDGDGAKASFHQ
mmetsp:Transcript_29741/g.41087  ORF Transcript_29741/g.41087 Transcript_29741/m.41087 type:complete len:237 (-) Transcript_29741:40-750(-)|eukprot:CAMPEP_0201490098 /NCGR_PEP_ID=MMETSP0151_2-20130828/25016_1 /ASSEMBLY_ACC=CAM_ASM_000257 /TAXON_ID=200890 /ORGANISM="Paramoeba atlantica, Strain 621/1 / CCAP 1560/9" /LENGTH=236 /DNA_ID=CAMNT_0047875915 /DNA_START=26 /DNA_END=736 /DNA_ORIENTATION=+